MSISRNRPKTVYYYCNLETFYEIITSSCLRLSNIPKSDDSDELTYLLPKVTSFCNQLFSKYNEMLDDDNKLAENFVNDAFDSTFNELSLMFYAICFSEESDLLSQWRGYTNDTRGVCIGINTDSFYPLAKSIHSNFNFSQIKYSRKDLYNHIKDYITNQIEEKWTDNQNKNSILLANLTDATVSMVLYNSVLYKNKHFQEEKEWRLVYNPFGNIRQITSHMDYYDRMHEILQKRNDTGGFVRNSVKFDLSNSKIRSYIDLSFEKIKQSFITEIIIGSKTRINKIDLDLFLLSNGYDPTQISIRDSAIPYR